MSKPRRIASARKSAFRRPTTGPRILSVGTAVPPKKYTQDEILELFHETSPKIRGLFHSSRINTRHLYLPEPVDGRMVEETNQELLDRHLHGALEIGAQAIEECLRPLGLAPYDIDCFCCVTTTGFLCITGSASLVGLEAYLFLEYFRLPA